MINKVNNFDNLKDNSVKVNRTSVISVYIIIVVTFLLLTPLILEARNNIPLFGKIGKKSGDDALNLNQSSLGELKLYTAEYKNIDFSFFDNEKYNFISAKIRNNGEIIFLYSEYVEYSGNVLRLMKKVKNHENSEDMISNYFLPQVFMESVLSGNYTYIDFNDNNIFISNDKAGYIFNTDTMEMEKMFRFPKDYTIYQAALSNGKDMFAFATDKGFFVCNSDFSNRKELISTISALNDTIITPKYPVWSENDEYIYYTLYANEYISGAGKTTVMPGGNEQYTELLNLRFRSLNNNKIFYHYSSTYHTSGENLFRCGYFDVTTKEMKDIIKSSVYYYDVKTGKAGQFIAALSNNGLLKKLNIINVRTKKILYSELFDEIYEFYFSPDETKFIAYARKGEENLLTFVDILEKTAESN